MRPVAAAALAVLLLALPPARAEDPAPPKAPPEIPAVAARAPAPPDPNQKIRKEVETALKDWFEKDPLVARPEEVFTTKGDRSKAASRLVGAVFEWNKALKASDSSLRRMDWWKARLAESYPTKQEKTNVFLLKDWTFNNETLPIGVSIPPAYRATKADLYPVILTVVDKDADLKKAFNAAYGPAILATHIVVAMHEPNVLNKPGRMLFPLRYVFNAYRADPDRVILDGLGKGAHFVEALAAESPCFFAGAIFRNPGTVSPLAANLALFPIAAVLTEPVAKPVQEALDAMKAANDGLAKLPATDLKPLQDWLAAVPPRRIADQKWSYAYWQRSSGRGAQGDPIWFGIEQFVDAGDTAKYGWMRIRRDPAKNLVDLECENVAAAFLRLNDEVFDLDQPITVRVNGEVVHRESKPARDAMLAFHYQEGFFAQPFSGRTILVTNFLRFTIPESARLSPAEREKLKPKEPPPPDTPPPENGTGEKPGGTTDEGTEATTPPASVWRADAGPSFEEAAKKGRLVLAKYSATKSDPKQVVLDRALEDKSLEASLANYQRISIGVQADAPIALAGNPDKLLEMKDAPRLYLFRPDYSVVGFLAIDAGWKPEEAPKKIEEWLGPMAATTSLTRPFWLTDATAVAAVAKRDARTGLLLYALAGSEAHKPLEALLQGALAGSLAGVPCTTIPVPADGTAPLPGAEGKAVAAKDTPALYALKSDGTLAGPLAWGALKPEEAQAALEKWLQENVALPAPRAVKVPAWSADAAGALKAAATDGHPTLLLFTAGPGPAQDLADAVLADPRSWEILEGVHVARVAVAAGQPAPVGATDRKVEARDAPVLYLLKPDGTVVDALPVTIPPPPAEGQKAEDPALKIRDWLKRTVPAPNPPPPEPPK